MNTRTTLLASCALVALAIATPAFAQPPADDQDTLIDELIVTTERRAQSLQDVPVSVTALDDETKERVGIGTISEMAQFTPGMYYNNATDRPAIRGIGRQDNSFAIDSPVANYLDGVYTSSVQDAARRPLFIDRNEILRGPQGSLAGRGSIAGSINTYLKRPDDEFGGAVSVQAGNYERYIFDATITGPITPWLRGRFNAALSRQGKGWFENAADDRTEGTNLGNRSTYDLLLEADAGEDVDIYFKMGWSDYKERRRSGAAVAPYIAGTNPCIPSLGGGNTPTNFYGLFPPGTGCGQVRLTVGPGAGGAPPPGTVVAFDPQPVLLGTQRTNPITEANLRQYNTNFPARQELTEPSHSYITHVTWHAPFADVKWIGGIQEYAYEHNTDADESPVESYLIGAATYNGPNTAPTITSRRISPGLINRYEEQREWYSNELTFTSVADGPLQWVAGLFASNEQYDQTPQTIFAPGFRTALAQPGAYAFAAFGLVPFPGATPPANQLQDRLTFGNLTGETNSYAAFGQVDYELNDRLKFTLGLRFNRDEKEVHERARFLQVTSTAAGDTVVDNTFSFFRGYTLVNAATAVVPAGYTLLPVDQFPLLAGSTTQRVLPDGSLAAVVTGTGPTGILFAPGVTDFPTQNRTTGARERDLVSDTDAVTGSIGVDFDLNDDTMLYARYARGYRPGGLNAGFINAVPLIKQETVNSYEIGAKATINGSLRINTSAFYYDYTDIQLPLPIFDRCTTPGDFSSCTSVNSFINLPSAVNKGIEVEAMWYPTENLQVLLSYGYLDARVKDGKTDFGFQNGVDPAALLENAQPLVAINCLVPVTGQTAGCQGTPGTLGRAIDLITGQQQFTQDLSGNRLLTSPKHKVAINANYTFRDVLQGGDITVSGSYIWRDESEGSLFNAPIQRTPAYDQVNLRAIFTSADEKYKVIAYVQNIFDDLVYEFSGATRRSVAGDGTGQIYYKSYDLAPPRTFGIEVQRHF